MENELQEEVNSVREHTTGKISTQKCGSFTDRNHTVIEFYRQRGGLNKSCY